MKKIYRNQIWEDYFKSFDFNAAMALNETYHELTCCDDFLNDIENILNNHLDDKYFYTGWNFLVKKEMKNNHICKVGKCLYENNVNINHPIFINFFENPYIDTYASIKRRNIEHLNKEQLKNDSVVININLSTFNIDMLKYELTHELTHAIIDYSEEKCANLNSLKYSLAYEDYTDFSFIDNIDEKMINVSRYLYWINKSEQDARISATLKYIKKYCQENKVLTIQEAAKYIQDSYTLNQLDKFEYDNKNINSLSQEEILLIGYFLQMHHYNYGKLYKDIVIKMLKNSNLITDEIISDIKNNYRTLFKLYRNKLLKYVQNINN